VKAAFPGFIKFALASSIEKVPSGARWLREIKFDGYRVQLRMANDDIKVFTRRNNDWTKRFKKIAADAYLINAAPRSSTARSWCPPPMTPPTSRSCRTS
jgi:bifunctional non-homologous end joining protein LigD